MTAAQSVPSTLESLRGARAEFIRLMNEDTDGAERARLLTVLDAMIEWSTARSGKVRFSNGTKPGVIAFEWIAKREVLWSAQPARGQAPKLTIVPRAAQLLSDEQRRVGLETVNAHTRDQVEAGERMRIGFGALKNQAARDAVMGFLDGLLVTT